MTGTRTHLVAGVNGFIGAGVARRLLADGARVFGLARRSSGDRTRLDEYSEAELRAAFASVAPEVVHNLASAGVAGDGTDPRELIAGNATLAVNLLAAAAGARVRRFVHTGSCFEYAEAPEGLLHERCAIHPWSVYGAAKAASVHLARTVAAKLNIPLVTLRLFGVYGPGEAPRRLIPQLVGRLQRGEPVELTEGRQVRDLLYIEDAAEAFRIAADCETLGDGGRAFNICSGLAVSVRDIGATAAELLNAPPELLKWGALPGRPEEPARIVGDSSAFRTATGWSPRFDLREGLRATIEASNHA